MRLLLVLLFLGGLVPSAYAAGSLHVGDKLQISVWQDPKLDRTVIVAPDGTIAFPLAGHVRAAGRSPEQVERILRSRLKKNYTGELDITVGLAAVNQEQEALTQPKVYITGEVQKPGAYPIDPPKTTVMQAISMAGGLGPFAAQERIQVHRQIHGVDSIFTFDYNAFESGRNPTENIGLRTGDVIVVPERGLLE
ncbi:MAG: polysaccharide biosynthesis/export family protein [Gammaproteobacteria bacterium]